MNIQKYNKTAFTLVELIIVILILSILMTIGYSSFSNYAMQSRNTSRILDTSTINKTLHIYETRAGRYPVPSNFKNITYSGATIWKQGTVGKSIFSILKLDKIPLDPLTDNMFSYSVLAPNNNKYEIGTIIEGDNLISNKFNINNIYASSNDLSTRITGNYTSKTFNNQIGNNIKIIALPSISSGNNNLTQLTEIFNNKALVYNGCTKLPAPYNHFLDYEHIDNNVYTPKKILLFDGNFNELISEKNFQKELFLNIQTAYTGTIFEDSKFIKSLLDLEIENDDFSIQFDTIFKEYIEKNFN